MGAGGGVGGGLLSVALPRWGGGVAKGPPPINWSPTGGQPTACTLGLWWLDFGPTGGVKEGRNGGGGGAPGGSAGGGSRWGKLGWWWWGVEVGAIWGLWRGGGGARAPFTSSSPPSNHTITINRTLTFADC